MCYSFMTEAVITKRSILDVAAALWINTIRTSSRSEAYLGPCQTPMSNLSRNDFLILNIFARNYVSSNRYLSGS